MAQRKQGPLSSDELLAIWQGAVPPEYSKPLIEAGEGRGLEVYTQAFAQWHAVSESIDVSTQAMYVLPWSGQTNPPAGLASPATVTLTITRTKGFDQLLLLAAGQVVVLEESNDYGEDAPQLVLTGRRYVLTEDVVFFPGDPGPITVTAESDLPGYGYNFPLPGNLRVLEQPGSGYSNALASVTSDYGQNPAPPTTQVFLVTANVADTLLPSHVGQYVAFDGGLNAGQVARIASFSPPSGGNGSAGQIDILACFIVFTPVGPAWQVGETVSFSGNSGLGTVIAARLGNDLHLRVAFRVTFENGIIAGLTATGLSSGASMTVDQIATHYKWIAEAPSGGSGGASWRILDWANDLGIVVTNVASPVGGQAGMLEALGKEKGVFRGPGESEDDFRDRVAKLADVVSPNAVKRALNRVLGRRGYPWCLREVGSSLLPGVFMDRQDQGGDAFDLDALATTGAIVHGGFVQDEPLEYQDANGNVLWRGFFGKISGGVLWMISRDTIQGLLPDVAPNAGDVIVGHVRPGIAFRATWAPTAFVTTPQVARVSRFSMNLDYADFRAFFLVGVPRLGLGEFGAAFDAGSSNAFDCAPSLCFFDGFPVGAAAFYGQVWQAVNTVRADGVGFDLYQINEPCS